ncbi:MAG: hypothetical protein EB075_13190 [Bacteroidetes bacterium]|nr:hypothetical protein [Bacteroidota bacterium]
MRQFVTVTVDELQEKKVEKPTTVANDESKRWRGGKGSELRMEERMNYAYSLLLEGNTRRANAQTIADRFGVSIRTADADISRAMEILRTENSEGRDSILNQVLAMRLATAKRAMKRGNFQVVAHLLDSIGRAAGELEASAQASAAPQLNITIDDKRNG